MRKRKALVPLVIILIFFTLCSISIIPLSNYLEEYLSKTEKVRANILLVEGWLPPYAIEMAFDEFNKTGYDYIVTTGLKKNAEYFNVFTDGYLIFYINRKNSVGTEIGRHVIEINAYSSLGGENRAHFKVFVNDSIAGEFFADKQKGKYEVEWKGSLSEIDSIMVQFDNDIVGDFGDRNLFVKEIIIDHEISIPYQHNSIYEISDLNEASRMINNFDTEGELARNKLLDMGIDSSIIKAIPGIRATINRTLASALSFRDWLKKTDIEVKGINIVSIGTHSRRTWMTYDKVLNKSYEIGIISLPDYKNHYSRKYKVLKTLRETIGLIYYWFILIPY